VNRAVGRDGDGVQYGHVKGLHWDWIAFGTLMPAVVSLLIAYPFWRKSQSIFGSIAGSIVIFGTALGLILREYVEIDRVTKACLDAGTTCWPEPSPFARFAVYAFVGLVEVIVLFSLSLKVEERIRRRDYAPEWRR
jgi:hypothetical protein